MSKILATIFLIVFIWVAYPHLSRGEWLAPTALPPYYWGLQYSPQYSYLSSPSQGYGWFRFDFWHQPSVSGRPVSQNDFNL